MARQMVNHGHVLVNGTRISIPSYAVGAGDVISLDAKFNANPIVLEHLKTIKEASVPTWLERKAGAGLMKTKPEREQITLPVEEQLIVEYYSR
jgi:small subunit ribosomal protein S4